MAGRLNHLFQTAPKQFMERTVIFVDKLQPPVHTLTHFIDLEPSGPHAKARVLAGQHLYQDAPLASYYLQPGGFVLIPRYHSPHRFVFLPEFTRCRLLISADGPDWLRLQLEQNLNGVVPPPDTKYLDWFAYWNQTGGDLVGVVRATAVLVKQPDEPWTVIMQQIVGIAGHEMVRQVFVHPLRIE